MDGMNIQAVYDGLLKLFAFLGALTAAYMGWQKNILETKAAAVELEKQVAKQETIHLHKSIDLHAHLAQTFELHEELKAYVNSEASEVDRVLFFTVFNGHNKPKYVSALRQWRKDGQEEEPYRNFPIDDHYIDLLMRMKQNNHVQFVVSEQPTNVVIRVVYDDEGVKGSDWECVRASTPEKPTMAFLSFSSHNNEKFTDAALAKNHYFTRKFQALYDDFEQMFDEQEALHVAA